ncbi:hypothetical protein Xkoz_00540 [Xenorhabdus kozodoii]|uniref:Uncharacterized protein n=1 Tax=Xenorhabdus kozodoii TaxID=351676 RepID=A0A2D0LGT8_9GAMM|nr:hypothetical protein Xkoz_00540 [Xenorhabdus kozodoii]
MRFISPRAAGRYKHFHWFANCKLLSYQAGYSLICQKQSISQNNSLRVCEIFSPKNTQYLMLKIEPFTLSKDNLYPLPFKIRLISRRVAGRYKHSYWLAICNFKSDWYRKLNQNGVGIINKKHTFALLPIKHPFFR